MKKTKNMTTTTLKVSWGNGLCHVLFAKFSRVEIQFLGHKGAGHLGDISEDGGQNT